MKKLFTTIIILALSTGVAMPQSAKDIIAMPDHVVGRMIDASGQVTQEYPADFQYNSEGMLSFFEFPTNHITSQFFYDNHYLSRIFTNYYFYSTYGEHFKGTEEFLFENGLIQQEHLQLIDLTYNNLDDDYSFYYYNEEGQLVRKENGYDGPDNICNFWTYEYDDQGRTHSVSYYISWGCLGYTCISSLSTYQYDDDLLREILIEEYDDYGQNIIGNKKQIYTYTEERKLASEITQTLIDGEWVNNSIHNYIYDANSQIAEQQDGTWSELLDDWEITNKTTHEFSMTEMTYTISFYKKSGENWVWDVFNGQTLFFEPELKWQQYEMKFFNQVNQIEFSMTQMVPVDEHLENGFAIYPSPANETLFVETQNLAYLPDQSYHIINTMGQTILSGRITAETQQINIDSLPAGLYFISVGNVTQKFVVK